MIAINLQVIEPYRPISGLDMQNNKLTVKGKKKKRWKDQHSIRPKPKTFWFLRASKANDQEK